MGYTVIAPVGDNPKALFAGMKEFPAERVILLTPYDYGVEAKKLQEMLDSFAIKSEIIELNGNVLESTFRIFGNLAAMNDPDNLVVNVATGDRMSTMACLSASYANGLRALGVADGRSFLLPVMKLSYYSEISGNKLKVLRALEGSEPVSLKVLAKKVSISISLLSYHINGNLKYMGLKEFRLVETKEKSKNVFASLTQMGNLLLKGYAEKKLSGQRV